MPQSTAGEVHSQLRLGGGVVTGGEGRGDWRSSCLASLTPVKQYKTVKASLTGVVDTAEEFLASINNTSNAGFAGGVDTGKSPK
jgi:hypothetical protein